MKPAAARFRKTVYDFYKANYRPMAWRDTRDPYRIIVSEVMLQQTQVSRVVEKYPQFIKSFPTVKELAEARLSDVLKAWQGLGYNRRALYLKRLAEAVVREHGGKIPGEREALRKLPGIGDATSASVCAFAFGRAHPFIETNIRSVFIHHFFNGRQGVADSLIMPLVEETLDRKDPRNWYYALFDYGVHLKEKFGNPSRKSLHYKRQSPLTGSVRQARARIIGYLVDKPGARRKDLLACVPEKSRFIPALSGLIKDGMIRESRGEYSIA